MKVRGEHVTNYYVGTNDMEERDNVVFEMLRNGQGYYAVTQSNVLRGSIVFCNDAYSERFSSECYYYKTDKRAIKVCAYEDAQSRGKGVQVISRHVSKKGTRRYYVSSWPHFLRSIYPKLRGTAKSFYENIYLDDPCRLYVDIDLDISDVVSKEKTVESVATFERYAEMLHAHVMKLVTSLKTLFEAMYPGVSITDVFVIDSSGWAEHKRKFSHHLIFHIDDDSTRFGSSAHLGDLFEYVRKTSCLCESKGVSQKSNPFFWPGDVGKRMLERGVDGRVEEEEEEVPAKNRRFIADLGVFGDKVREFRIVGSSKYGEDRPLKLIHHLRFANNDFAIDRVNFDKTLVEFKSFSRLLVCFIDKNVPVTKLLTFDLKNTSALNALITSFTTTTDDVSFKVRTKCGNKRRTNVHDRIVEDDFATTADMKEDYARFPPHLKKMFDVFSNEKRREYVFSVVAADILRQNPQLDDEPEWTRFMSRDGSYVVSYRTTSKYCEIKGDEHTSNHVFYVVWLKSKCYYQRCWNDECRALRGNVAHDRNAPFSNATIKDNDDDSQDGDGDNDDGDNNKTAEIKRQTYEENKDVKTCKAATRQLSTDTWQTIQDFLRDHVGMVEAYKAFKSPVPSNDDANVVSIADYEVLEDVDLSGDDNMDVEVDYSTDRFKRDRILDDLFPPPK